MAADRRTRADIVAFASILVLVAVLTGIYALLQGTDESSWPYVTNTILFAFLSILNVLLIISLLVILVRNLIKLLVERWHNILGSRFRTKLVFTFLGLCLIPSIVLFTAAVGLIERSSERWFASPVEKVNDDARRLVDGFYASLKTRNERFASDIAADVTHRRSGSTTGEEGAMTPDALETVMRVRQLDLLSIITTGAPALTTTSQSLSGLAVPTIPSEVLSRALTGGSFSWQEALGGGQLVRAGVPLFASDRHEVVGVLVTGTFVASETAAATARIQLSVDRYKQMRLQKQSIKRVYILLICLITLVILVSVTWLGLYLAGRITVPIQMLAEGTRAVFSGDLGYQVAVTAGDELGTLVESFNRMTRELQSSRSTIERSNRELVDRAALLEERRSYIETLLESLSTGVVSLDGAGRVTTLNRAARRMLRLEASRDVLGAANDEILGGESLADIGAMIPRLLGAHGASITREFHVTIGGQPVSLAVTFSPLTLGTGEGKGLLIVLEDITSLIKAQKAAAWREVARRMAHEIKNPLTPIQLSAQRILRKWREGAGDLGVAIEEGAGTIVSEVKTLKTLVNEFSGFARMPAANPTDADLHEVIDSAVGLYQGPYPEVVFGRDYDRTLPTARLDPDQMKRVFVNLIDNALEAMGRRGEISIGTHWFPEAQTLRVEFADDGPGIPPEDKEKLFLPYFSTKKRGTGLGLAIVSRIVSDHRGYIRVEDNRPHGTRFIIDLPSA